MNPDDVFDPEPEDQPTDNQIELEWESLNEAAR